MALAGCAGMQSYREGQSALADGKVVSGIGKLKEMGIITSGDAAACSDPASAPKMAMNDRMVAGLDSVSKIGRAHV